MTDPILVALIAGIVSLVVAGLSNFGAEAYRRRIERRALAAGLAGELAAFSSNYENSHKSLTNALASTRAGKRLPMPKIKADSSPYFEANAGKLGSLGPRHVEDVVYVYMQMAGMRQLIDALHETQDAGVQAALISQALSNMEKGMARGKTLIVELRKVAGG